MRTIGLAICALILAASCAIAQQPKAVITGPKEADAGDLVILDATQSQGESFAWAIIPPTKVFLPVDSGQRCVFASGQPGTWQFALVAAGKNANGGASVDVTLWSVTITGPTPIPPGPDPPGPSPDPTPGPGPSVPGPKELIILRESSEVDPDVATLLLKLRTDPAMQAALKANNHRLTILDPDQRGSDGNVERVINRLRTTTNAPSLPCLYVVAGSALGGRILAQGPLPSTVDEVLAILRRVGG